MSDDNLDPEQTTENNKDGENEPHLFEGPGLDDETLKKDMNATDVNPDAPIDLDNVPKDHVELSDNATPFSADTPAADVPKDNPLSSDDNGEEGIGGSNDIEEIEAEDLNNGSEGTDVDVSDDILPLSVLNKEFKSSKDPSNLGNDKELGEDPTSEIPKDTKIPDDPIKPNPDMTEHDKRAADLNEMHRVLNKYREQLEARHRELEQQRQEQEAERLKQKQDRQKLLDMQAQLERKQKELDQREADIENKKASQPNLDSREEQRLLNWRNLLEQRERDVMKRELDLNRRVEVLQKMNGGELPPPTDWPGWQKEPDPEVVARHEKILEDWKKGKKTKPADKKPEKNKDEKKKRSKLRKYLINGALITVAVVGAVAENLFVFGVGIDEGHKQDQKKFNDMMYNKASVTVTDGRYSDGVVNPNDATVTIEVQKSNLPEFSKKPLLVLPAKQSTVQP